MLLLRVRDIILTNVRHALLLLLGTPSNTFGDTFQKQVDLFEKRSIIKKSSWED